MRPWTIGLVLLLGCDRAAVEAEDEAAGQSEAAPVVDESKTNVDRAALAALCIRGTLTVELNGKSATGVLIDKKDGTQRFGWVSGVLAPSPFNELTAEQVARELELQLKVADTMQSALPGTCTKAIEGAKPVILTFVVEHKPSELSPIPGHWVVAGTTASRSIEFTANSTLAQAQSKALELARDATKANEFSVGSADYGSGRIELCPGDWRASLP